jgi:hypothetical protein
VRGSTWRCWARCWPRAPPPQPHTPIGPSAGVNHTERRHPTGGERMGFPIFHPADTSRKNLAAALCLLSSWLSTRRETRNAVSWESFTARRHSPAAAESVSSHSSARPLCSQGGTERRGSAAARPRRYRAGRPRRRGQRPPRTPGRDDGGASAAEPLAPRCASLSLLGASRLTNHSPAPS